MRLAIVIAFFLAFAGPGVAQDIDQSKKYGTEPDCGYGDGGGLTLDFTTGIDGIEFHCDFFEVKSKPGSPWLLVEAICEEPGLRNPDLLSITPHDEDSIEVVSLYDTSNFPPTDENPDPGTSFYHACN